MNVGEMTGRGARRLRRSAQFGVILSTLTMLLALSACSNASPTVHDPLAPTPTATATLDPTNTPNPGDVFHREMSAVTNLRGHLIGTEYDLSYQMAHAWIFVSDTSLATAQWDAYHAQQAAWQGDQSILPDGWIVSVHLYDGPFGTGNEIAVADVGTATGRRVHWAHLSPSQAWQTYDHTLYNPKGI